MWRRPGCALTGLHRLYFRIPRPLAWAGMFRPLRGDEGCEFRLSCRGRRRVVQWMLALRVAPPAGGCHFQAQVGTLQGMKLLLLFDNVVVGEITDAFEHQGTRVGSFQCSLPADGDKMAQRLRAFIEFCQDWFERSGSDAGANPSEFDLYRDLVASGKWSVKRPGGDTSRIEDAPMFQDGLKGEISWLERSS
jgi:hypothetical protein